jgi:hypothetical protein
LKMDSSDTIFLSHRTFVIKKIAYFSKICKGDDVYSVIRT